MKQTPKALLAMHDLLVANLQAAGKPHPAENCGFCTGQYDLEDRVADPKTYSEDELRAAVNSAVEQAVAKLRTEKDAEIASLRQAQEQADVDARIAEAKQPLEARISELEGELTTKTVEADAQKARADALEQAEADRQAEEERLAGLSAKKDERAAKVREAVKLDSVDKLIEENGEKWAAMDDAAFDTLLDSLTAAAAAAPARERERRLPSGKASAMSAAEEGDPTNGRPRPSGKRSLLRDFYDHVNA